MSPAGKLLLSALASLFEAPGVKFAARRALHTPDETDVGAILIRSGIACLFKWSEKAHVRVVALRYPGEVIAPEELRFGLGVQALVLSNATRVPAEEFSKALEANGSATAEWQRQAARNSRIALEWLVRATYEAPGKIAHLLCETAVRTGHGMSPEVAFELPFTQEQLAAITGQTGVNVNRVVRDFERQNLIAGPKRRMNVNWGEIRRIGRFEGSYLSL